MNGGLFLAFADVTRRLRVVAPFLAVALSACSASSVSGPGGGAGPTTNAGGTTDSSTGGRGGILLDVLDSGNADVTNFLQPTEDANCGHRNFDVTRRPADLLLLIDRSASMIEHDVTGLGGQQVTRAQAAKDAVNQAIQQTEAAIEWGLKMFPEGNTAYCVVTPKVDADLALNNYAKISGVINADAFDGDGTPTAAAVSAADTYLTNFQDSNAKYIVLATDGEPSSDDKNQCTGDFANPDVKTAAVNAVATAASHGFKTFVIGVNTSSSSNVTLNRLAQAGQTANPAIAAGEDITSSKDTTQHYYAAADAQGLVDSLSQITGQISDCRFSLGAPPPAPDNVVVKISDASGSRVRVPLDTSHSDGWDYTGADQLTIQVYGTWCDKVKAHTANNAVSIIFGCKGEIIP